MGNIETGTRWPVWSALTPASATTAAANPSEAIAGKPPGFTRRKDAEDGQLTSLQIAQLSAISTHGTVWLDCVSEGLRLILTPHGRKDGPIDLRGQRKPHVQNDSQADYFGRSFEVTEQATLGHVTLPRNRPPRRMLALPDSACLHLPVICAKRSGWLVDAPKQTIIVWRPERARLEKQRSFKSEADLQPAFR